MQSVLPYEMPSLTSFLVDRLWKKGRDRVRVPATGVSKPWSHGTRNWRDQSKWTFVPTATAGPQVIGSRMSMLPETGPSAAV